MKKSVIFIFLIGYISFPSLAQKEIKPSTSNAEKALRAGKYEEAKTIIDATTSNQGYMVDKKGGPSKNAATAWYLRGVIYAAFDTTKVQSAKAVVPDGFPTAKESFDKAKAIDKDQTPAFLKDAVGFPIMNDQVSAYLAQSYFTHAVSAYQDDKDYKKAFELTERTLYFIPNDTSILMNAGVFFAPSAGEYDKAIKIISEYQEKGGTSPDAYVMLFSIYRDQKKDNEAALKLSQELVAKYPNNTEYPKFLLDMYVKMNKLPEAKELMMKQAAADPQNKESRYFVGIICNELKDPAGAKKWFEEAIKIDPTYFEPRLELAQLIYQDAKTIKAEMNQLGNSKEDFNKKLKLDKEYQDKLRVALPYWANCEKLSPDDEKVLDTLYIIYADLEMTSDVARIEKRMKALGLLD
ncbi:MAG: tetratricopeptide repeat protein [Cyclobacteriaceae bacterium]|jgi:tetratricopeptide (TPR) repeat protein|nr:tetratricopeptide repeat protein [Cyclobacteriaceae bacterium]